MLDCNGLNCHDILQLFSKVTSGDFYEAKLLLRIEHTFTVNGPPFSHASRKLGPQKQSKLFKQINYMLINEIIEYSCSPCTSPVHLVPKKDPNTFRFCVDYRTLNS